MLLLCGACRDQGFEIEPKGCRGYRIFARSSVGNAWPKAAGRLAIADRGVLGQRQGHARDQPASVVDGVAVQVEDLAIAMGVA